MVSAENVLQYVQNSRTEKYLVRKEQASPEITTSEKHWILPYCTVGTMVGLSTQCMDWGHASGHAGLTRVNTLTWVRRPAARFGLLGSLGTQADFPLANVYVLSAVTPTTTTQLVGCNCWLMENCLIIYSTTTLFSLFKCRAFFFILGLPETQCYLLGKIFVQVCKSHSPHIKSTVL